MGYLIALLVPALPAEGLAQLTGGKLKKECKRSYAVSAKTSHKPLQLYFTAAEDRVAAVPQAAQPFLCGSPTTLVPPALAHAFAPAEQQEIAFVFFTHSLYTLLFQELDPDPPRASFC